MKFNKNQDTKNPVKIVFFGTSDFAVPALSSLLNFGYEVIAVITQPEKPVGRAKVILPSPVKKTALLTGINVLEFHSLKDEENLKHFKHLSPDLCIVAAYGKIIPSRYLEIPKFGFLNIHPSLLPKYRGPSPIQTAIINGDKESGVAIMKMDDQVDHGPVLAITGHEVPAEENYREVEAKYAKLGAELLIDVLPKYLNGEIKPQEQDHSRPTFTKLITRADGKINWNNPAEEIYNRIRALNPEPGTWTTLKGKILNIKKVKILKSEASTDPGTVVRIEKNIVVATSKFYLILEQIQLEGGKEMDVKNFINGHPDFIGSILG